MKSLVIIGVTTEGKRDIKTVQVNTSTEIVSAPSKFGFSKVSAVMTAESYKQVMQDEH